jgi:hypothetical protein
MSHTKGEWKVESVISHDGYRVYQESPTKNGGEK